MLCCFLDVASISSTHSLMFQPTLLSVYSMALCDSLEIQNYSITKWSYGFTLGFPDSEQLRLGFLHQEWLCPNSLLLVPKDARVLFQMTLVSS